MTPPVRSKRESEARPYHHGDLRRSLLEAARELIVEHGVPGTSLREIARRAGVSNRAPYHHFDDKLHLLAALAREGFERLECLMAESETVADPVTRLERLGLAYLRFAAEHPGDFQTMHWDELCDLQNFPDRAEAAEGPFRHVLDTLEAIADRPVDREELRRFALLAWSTVHGLATLRSQGVLDVAYAGGDLDRLSRDVVARTTRLVVAELRCSAAGAAGGPVIPCDEPG